MLSIDDVIVVITVIWYLLEKIYQGDISWISFCNKATFISLVGRVILRWLKRFRRGEKVFNWTIDADDTKGGDI